MGNGLIIRLERTGKHLLVGMRKLLAAAQQERYARMAFSEMKEGDRPKLLLALTLDESSSFLHLPSAD